MAGKKQQQQQPGVRYPDLPGWMQGFDLTEQEWKGVRVYVGVLPVHRLVPNEGQIEGLPANPREWTEDEFSNLRASLVETPELFVLRPCLITPPSEGEEGWEDIAVVLGGNMRLLASKANGEDTVPVGIYPRSTTPVEKMKEIVMKDNGQFGRFDWDKVANEWDDCAKPEWGIRAWNPEGDGQQAPDGSGNGSGTGAGGERPRTASLADRFVVPPFSILDTRKGYWQARKRVWRSIVTSKEIAGSREDVLLKSPEVKYKDLYLRTKDRRKELGISFREYIERFVTPEELEHEAGKVTAQGTSLFDPVLAEIVMRWFCRPGGRILDPFGGEQTKGLVAGILGLGYEAVEIRPEQVEANTEACKEYPSVTYHTGDSNRIDEIITGRDFDLCFTSPPYYDLEVYSKEDMSALGTYEEFMAQYENIFRRCVGMLADGAFLVVKVGEIRDKATGAYRNFVGDNIALMMRLGLSYYNEIILVETGASTAMRAGRYMESRKVAKMHQNVLVFYKGDLADIKARYPRIEVTPEDEAFFRQEFTPAGEEAPDGDNDGGGGDGEA